jgi:hypothetical protein
VTIEIKLLERNANRVIDIVIELRRQGYVQGQDFDFAYSPERYDNFSHEPVMRAHAVFTFYDDSLASWFAIKYS